MSNSYGMTPEAIEELVKKYPIKEYADGGRYINIENYLFSQEDARSYLPKREHWAKELLALFKDHYGNAERSFQGSQDGEAVVALLPNGDLANLVHLDPATIDALEEAQEEGKVKELFQEILNDM